MSQQPLVQKVQNTQKPLIEQPLITRYNIFIENYNKPNCIVDNKILQKMGESSMHNSMFTVLTDWKGKIIFIILLFIPIFNEFIFLACLYSTYIYWSRLALHQQNMRIVNDPFRNMVFDPQLCFKLHKDFYAFTIQFKQLQGFSLNYNKDMRKELSLRQERGKANFMIYNTNFWASFHHFGKWKRQHISLLLTSLTIATAINIIIFVFYF